MTGSENSGARDNPAAPGVALRAARTAQNLGVGEVARQLRLSVAQVEALEASAFERLPGPVFVRGFIRNYARLLKLDPEPLLRDLAPASAPEQEPHVARVVRAEPIRATRTARWPWYAFAAVMLIVALAVYEFLLAEPSRPALPVSSGSVTILVPVAPPLKDSTTLPAPAAAGTEGEGRDPAARTEADASTPAAGAVVAVTGTRDAAGPAAGEAEIRMNFDRDSWVEIRDHSGSTIFSQLNRSGSEQRVKGRPPLVVVVGNARGVRLTYNDRAVDLAQHTKYDVARLTLE
jgi:cytoskeleton protein RodZ